jgi:two-component system, OmpR family, sensor histidine kinase KdpD
MPLFLTDRVSLEQIFHNIIDNALQHTPKGTEIEICVAWENETFTVAIEDNGPGFPKGELGRVFDKFYRLGNSRSGGTGLGLSIVKGFVESLGGKVTLENIPSGGAKFIVYIPARSSTIQTSSDE